MTRKRHYLISAAVLAACVCIAIGVMAMLPPRPGVTKASYSKIRFGMSKSEVISILNSKPHFAPGEKSAKPTMSLGSLNSMLMEAKGHVWDSEECTIYVRFADDDTVTGSMISFLESQPESLTDKVRRWLLLRK